MLVSALLVSYWRLFTEILPLAMVACLSHMQFYLRAYECSHALWSQAMPANCCSQKPVGFLPVSLHCIAWLLRYAPILKALSNSLNINNKWRRTQQSSPRVPLQGAATWRIYSLLYKKPCCRRETVRFFVLSVASTIQYLECSLLLLGLVTSASDLPMGRVKVPLRWNLQY